MSLAGAGQRRYLQGVERKQLDMLGPVSIICRFRLVLTSLISIETYTGSRAETARHVGTGQYNMINN